MKEKSNIKLAVIGAGPGGYAAAFKAADLGMDVTLIDPSENPGGVCLYRGCIPSKALLYVAKIKKEAAEAGEFGLQFEAPKVAISKMRKWKDGVVHQLTAGLGQLAKQRKVNFIKGTARFLGSHELEIQSGEKKQKESFDKVVIATGSKPSGIPTVEIDHEYVIDSTDALSLKKIPKSMLVIGGGYIGLELGSVYASLGAQVSIVEMTEGFLPGADRDLVEVLHKEHKELFKEVLFSTKVESVKVEKKKVVVGLSDKKGKKSKTYDQVLLAIGRTPNTDQLSLNKAGVDLGDRGFIPVNMQRQTNQPHIYAIGDVTGEPMLAHKASKEGIVAAESAAGAKGAGYDPQGIPAVVFTNPEIAWCGLTETAAKSSGKQYKTVKFPWVASGRAGTMGTGNGLTKLLVDPQSQLILGAGIAGKDAGSLIAEVVLAMEMGATATDLALTIHPHPTLSETIMESAELFLGKATHYLGT